jgi:hypothetical protein
MAKPTGKPNGRPSIYTPELAEEICQAISVSNKALQTICMSHEHWPSYVTIWDWIQKDRNGFAKLYAEAKEAQADYLCESILTIIDKPETFVDENGNERNDVAMMRLKVDSMKWQAMKLKPKKYDKYVEDLQADNERVKKELQELKDKLDLENLREY